MIAAIALMFSGLANAAPTTLVGGEGSGSSTSMTASASMEKGVLSITLVGVVGTDVKGQTIIPAAPDGSVVCMKANGQQSADWRAGHVLGKIATNPDACFYGRGTVQGGKVTLTSSVCPAGRGEAAAVMSGVVQTPDGRQGWVPHAAPYRVLNAKGVDATAVAIDCTKGQVAPLAASQAKVLAKLF